MSTLGTFQCGFMSLECVSQELENLRKQAEIIPQLMAECESITEKLQVLFKYITLTANLLTLTLPTP